MSTRSETPYSRQLPDLLASLHLLYAGRLLLGWQLRNRGYDPDLSPIDAQIEHVTDDLNATELLHEAALILGHHERSDGPPAEASSADDASGPDSAM